MKNTNVRKIIGVLLAVVLLFGTLPASGFTAFAGHKCPDCEDWIDGSPYCEECYKCDACVDLCIECGKCTDCTGSEICDGCSNEEIGDNMCLECAIDKGTHCPDCDQCYFAVGEWCEECGLCTDCAGDIDTACSAYYGQRLCFDCAIDKGESHCPGCDVCYNEIGHFCGECGLCEDCVEYDEECSETYGTELCVECAAEKDSHCFGCEQCYFVVGEWCEECGLCEDCIEIDTACSSYHGMRLCFECASDKGTHCPGCDQCYAAVAHFCGECGLCDDCVAYDEECSMAIGSEICVECAIESGMHCPDCSECYGDCGGDFCMECGICGNCAEINLSEDLCLDCAIAAGLHCPGCESYIEDSPLCEGCGERCLECAESFCENCNLCSECVLMCQDCGSCEECATICPSCEEYCSECAGICDDCDLCLICCEDIANFSGCDCGEWVCVENTDWDEHFAAEHTDAQPGQIGHSVRPTPPWDWDPAYHWHNCAYCREDAHVTGKSAHTFDAKGICTVCRYVRDAEIQILVQPSDSKAAYVTSADEAYDERNIARFGVKAAGKSKLTYTWYEGFYHHGLGGIKYTRLTDPQDGEDYEGDEIYWLVPTDACTRDWYIRCVITDAYGNEVTTRDALVQAKHHYQYFIRYHSNEYPCDLVERNKYGHILQCVGEECEEVTSLRPHEDEDRNGYCDICEFEIGAILITKQPKKSTTAYSYDPDEGYDESNFAHFSVTAEGESALTYTWCRKQKVGGVWKYVPLTAPQEGEVYDGPELTLLVPEDACCTEYTYACIITDEEDNETRTVDVTLTARHNYQYYEDYLTTRSDPYGDARKKYHGHILVCVSPACGKVTRLCQHVDENDDYICETCGSQKDMVYPPEIFVTAPKEGQLPDYTVTVDRPACYTAMGGVSNYTQYRFWMVSDDGVNNWKIIDKNTPFVAGKYYKFVVEMQTKSGYTFPTLVSYDDCEPYIWVKVNGNYTKAHKTYDMDPDHYVTITYEFGLCNDSEIQNIVIDNVTEPIGGEKPTYTATVRGSGYHVDTEYTRYVDDYMPWPIPENEREYYIVNGIGWFDLTSGDWLCSHERFVPGHEYTIYVSLKTEDGYEFKLNKYYEVEYTASINGFVATGDNSLNDGPTAQTVCASFVCQGKVLSSVSVNSLNAPRAGETPDYTPVTAYPEWYVLDPNYGGTGGVVWFRADGTQMLPDDVFVEGERYRVEMKIVPAKLEGADASQFASPVSAYVNGNAVVENAEWDAVYASSSAVYIYYTFPRGAAPEKGKDVSGTITCVGDAPTGGITLQLIPQGQNEPAYEKVIHGDSTSYRFTGVARGVYVLKVQREGCHTATYTVTVEGMSVTQDVTLTTTAAIVYTVTYNANGGTGSMAATGGVMGNFTLPQNGFTAPAGKTFDGWMVNGTKYAAGDTVMITADTTAIAQWKASGEPSLLGDVNGKNAVDSTDARLVLQYAVKKIGTLPNLAAADVNGNGTVDSTDARLILQYAVKKIKKFPAEG